MHERPADNLPSLRRSSDSRSAAAGPARALSPTAQLVASPHEPTVALGVVLGLARAVVQAGGPRDALLSDLPIDVERPRATDLRLPCSLVHRLCERALALTGDPALGLHWSERITQTSFIPILPLIAHAPTLGQALETLAHFHRLVADEPSCALIEDGATAMVRRLSRSEEPSAVTRLWSELMVGSILQILRWFAPDAAPAHAHFAYAAPAHRDEYMRVFAGRARFAAPYTALVFDRSLLSRPSPDRDAEVHALFLALAERRLQRLTHQMPYALRVREFLVQAEWWRHRTGMPTVAHGLGLSVRSLRRLLAQENTSFTELVSETLALAAKRLLREPRTIDGIAQEMGFSDTSSFHRAFKQWTGTTPHAYRQAQLVD